jgi:hypothetical protein
MIVVIATHVIPGAWAQLTSPETMTTGPAKDGGSRCSWFPGLALLAIPD